jgi:hypothetical protein
VRSRYIDGCVGEKETADRLPSISASYLCTASFHLLKKNVKGWDCTVLVWRLYCLFIGRGRHVVQQNEAARIPGVGGSVLHMQKQSYYAPSLNSGASD